MEKADADALLTPPPDFRAGFVNIIGRPNVGKSTLLNALVGHKISIVTPKAQTTRHRILGILNGPHYQIVFSDTPGIIRPAYRMHEAMMQFVKQAADDADVLMYMTDVHVIDRENADDVQRWARAGKPFFFLINKIDLADQQRVEEWVRQWEKRLPDARIFPISALHRAGVDGLIPAILEYLPHHPPYFDSDQVTDRSDRFLISEIIREKIFEQLRQEVPYSTEVVVRRMAENERGVVEIDAEIFVNRASQKPILIGKQGRRLKQIGMAARKEIEQMLDRPVYLRTHVKVREGWREDPRYLRQFGYEG